MLPRFKRHPSLGAVHSFGLSLARSLSRYFLLRNSLNALVVKRLSFIFESRSRKIKSALNTCSFVWLVA